MTLLKELIDIPERVHQSDFVISLKSAIEDPVATMRDYVVTKQLVDSFDEALSLITSAVGDRRSKSTYLHASFGAGKSAFMAVLHLLLQGEPAATTNPELAPVVANYSEKLAGRKFLLVPYQAVGADSIEQIVLGGYVEHLQRLHPEAPLPPVYVADGIVNDAVRKRQQLGDDTFFRVLSDGEVADEWGDFGAGWEASRFEAAVAAAPGTTQRDELISALLRTHYSAVPGQAQATGQGFVPLDNGLEAVSRHAKALGYDAVVMFLDELVLWLASRIADADFVAKQGSEIVKLVEGDAGQRPAPIVGFIARQRELRELVGDHIMGIEAANVGDVLRHHAGRFSTITLEDRNLPAIAERRLLRPVDESARARLDETFEQVRRQLDERGERDTLLTGTSDLDAFRKLYPFSPALIEALVALSGAMQRERTALKVMLQLLVEQRDTLALGQLVPVGDLFDVINRGDEPLTEVMRAQFAQARRLWATRFQPLLLAAHSVNPDQIDALDPSHAFVTDARLVKTLLVAALVPEVAPLRNLTVSRLTALNSGTVQAFIPGAERQLVLDKLRTWTAEIGELQLSDDDHDPTVSVVLDGIDTGPMLDAARVVDNDGSRRQVVKTMVADLLGVQHLDSLDPTIEVTWRGFARTVEVRFANVRDAIELPDEELRAGSRPKLVIDYPWDTGEYGPSDDRARIEEFRLQRAPEWTAVWLPNFFTASSERLIGDLVRLDWLLTGDTFDQHAGHLSPSDRPLARSQLVNQQHAVRERVKALLRQAYGVDQPQTGQVDTRLFPADQFNSLDPGLTIRPQVGTSLRGFAEGIIGALFAHRYPLHPEFADRVGLTDLRHTLAQVTAAVGQPNHRLENVEPQMRKVLTKVAGPARLGTMHAAHFIADVQYWIDLIEQRRTETGTTVLTVGTVRTWLDGADDPKHRRGMPPELANLIILAVCAATDRTLVENGRVVAQPDLARLRDELEIRAQELPSEQDWQTALQRAADMGVVPASQLRTAASVADLIRRIHAEIVADRADAARDLLPKLRLLQSIVPVDDDSDRVRTANAAIKLVDELHRRPDQAVEVLAGLDVPTSAASIGTSIAQSPSIVRALQDVNLELLRLGTGHSGVYEAEAGQIRDALAAAVAAEERTVQLSAALAQAEQASTDLLAKLTKVPPAPAPPTDDRAALRQAGAALTDVANQLGERGFTLKWTIVGPDGVEVDLDADR